MTKIDALAQATRPIVTLMFAVTVCYGLITKSIGTDAFLGLASMVFTFWFTSRSAQKNGDTPTTPAPPVTP